MASVEASQLRGSPNRRLAFAVLAASLFAGACGSGSAQLPLTPTTTPTPLSQQEQRAQASRWGYDPRTATGERDPPPQFVELPPDYHIETYATGLTQPTALAFLPDGRMLVAEQRGTVRVVENGLVRPEPFFTANVYSPREALELGLVGMTVDPEFEENRHVYLYYTTDEPVRRTVLARVHDTEGIGTDLEEVLSMEIDPPCCHIAGGLRFAPDGMLFVAVGDHQSDRSAQNRLNPFGSILRIDRNGDAPPDNPFVGDGDPRIYAYGLRNPFGLAIDPATGRLFATENGFVGQDAILEIQPGANYGWPGYDLDVPLEEIAQPALFYHQAVGPAGIEFYAADQLPELTGTLLFCQFHGSALHVVRFDADGNMADDSIIALACTSDVLTGPDGFVYFLDVLSGTVHRITRE